MVGRFKERSDGTGGMDAKGFGFITPDGGEPAASGNAGSGLRP
ncbi:MAG: hypothetical protein ACREPY_07740 [Rhodanobacteraceae bacterium]